MDEKYSRIDDSPECLTTPSIVEEHLVLLQCGELLTRFRDLKSCCHFYRFLVSIQSQLS